MAILEINHLKKSFGQQTVLKDVHFSVKEHTIFGFIGQNGAGKTTTIKMLSCLTQPTQGCATIYGFDLIKDAQNIKQIINVSPQETAIAPMLSVKENLEFICEIYGFCQNQAQQKTVEIMKDLQLSQIANQRAGTLSGGWQRRLSIAMALISEPKILFLDEPTLGLDVIARRELWDFIKKLKQKMTIILTTHYLEEAENLSDHIGIMNQGQFIISGSVKELLKQANTDNFEDAFIQLSHQEALL